MNGDPDAAKSLPEQLNPALLKRWNETAKGLDFAHGTRRARVLPRELEGADLAKHCQPKVTAAPVTSYLLSSSRTKNKKMTVEKTRG